MEATIETMEKFYPIYGYALLIMDEDGNEFSANPSDYFWCNDPKFSFGDLLVKIPSYFEPTEEGIAE